ncbi:MAG: AAA-like domain-containing protein [Acidobacteriaceae bacterium]|jgi:hypothetical protein
MVFISYSRLPEENAEFVRQLAARLRAANFEVWLDEERISVADNIQEKIVEAISSADAALFVVNSRWLQKDRDFIQFEISLVGDQRAARRVVVLREPAGVKELGPYFCTLNRMEWYPDDPQPDARFWEIYCGITGTPPGPRNEWEARGRSLSTPQPVPNPIRPTAPVTPPGSHAAPRPATDAKVVAPPAPAIPRAPKAKKALRVALLYKRNAQPDDHVLALLENGLRDAGHDVFIDRHLRIGVEWATEIERQVREADAVIPLLSAAAVQSEMLEGEVKIAWEAAGQTPGKPRILPIRVNFEEPLKDPFYSILGRLQYAMWRTPADDAALLSSLLDSLEAREAPKQLQNQVMPKGTEPLDSPYYIVQAADLEFQAALESREEFIVCVKGARQMGKTSLLARGMQQAEKAGIKVASVDFMGLNQTALADIDSFYKGLGEMIAVNLDLDVFPDENWSKERAPNTNFERYIRREVLGKIDGHMILAMDEVDRLFAHPWASDVFGMFRSWHEERRRKPESHWKRLTLAFVYATEPHLFITRQDMSPFNVGTKLELHDFGIGQVEKLNQLYSNPLRSAEQLERFFALFNGQPYLTRRGFYEMTTHGMSLDQLESGATDEGPFGDHLRRILVMLASDKELLAVVKGLVRGEAIPDQASFYRLRSGGVITGSDPQDAHFRCGIYRTYLERHLD